ncbi:MAG: hypothetical protein PHD76_14600, partial [Methylacidiphilales bacterium]|nr:hypothetical protein [Candidatus Methylacidiphilales bacterium]
QGEVLLKDIIKHDEKPGDLAFLLMHLKYRKTQEEYDVLKSLLKERNSEEIVVIPVMHALTHFQNSKCEDAAVDTLIEYATIEEEPDKYPKIDQFGRALRYKTVSLGILSQFNTPKAYNYFSPDVSHASKNLSKVSCSKVWQELGCRNIRVT